MRRIWAWLSVILALGAVPMLMGPSGGYPSAPTFSGNVTSTVNRVSGGQWGFVAKSAAPHIAWIETDQSADNKIWFASPGAGVFCLATLNDAESLAKNFLCATRSGNAVTSIALGNGTDLPSTTINGIDVTPASGTFNSNVQGTGCTTGSVTWAYRKIGKIVSVKLTARTNFPAACSGSSMLDSSGNFPLALRPVTSVETYVGHGTNNAVATGICVQFLSTGNINYGVMDSTGCNTTGWTGVGNRDFAVGNGATYSLD